MDVHTFPFDKNGWFVRMDIKKIQIRRTFSMGKHTLKIEKLVCEILNKKDLLIIFTRG